MLKHEGCLKTGVYGIRFEKVPDSLKGGLIVPIYKGKGKDPLLTSSYRGITLSSSIVKLFEIIILQRLSPLLEDMCMPDILQTAYQSGLSCTDAIFATQETLLLHLKEGGKPYLCFHDVEKAFVSVEIPILLRYSHSTSRVKLDDCISGLEAQYQ